MLYKKSNNRKARPMKHFWIAALMLPIGLFAQPEPKAAPTFKAFVLVGEEGGWLRPNAAIGAIRSVEAFEESFKADAHIPAPLAPVKKKAAPEEPKKGDKFMQLDPAEQRKAAYGQRVRENERAYYEKVQQRKQEYYNQINTRSLLSE